MLTVGSDFFIWSFNQFEKKKYLLPYLCRQAYLPKAGDWPAQAGLPAGRQGSN